MPVIVIKDYHWRQSQDYVIVHVPVNNPPINVDLFVVDDYLKVSFAPFILELFLWGCINEEESRCTISENELILTLKKTTLETEWPNLESLDLDKEIKRERRECAINRAHFLTEERVKRNQEKQKTMRDKSVRAQIDLDTSILNRIQHVRDSTRKQAMRELDEWASTSEKPFMENEVKTVQENRNAFKKPLKWFKDEASFSTEKHEDKTATKIDKEPSKNDYPSEIWNGFDTDEDEEQASKVYRPGKTLVEKIIKGKVIRKRNIFDDPEKSVPMPRKAGTISVSFSERVFPTPARESHRIEEEEWLQKQAEARRKTGFVAEDLRPEERDPQWLQDKGDDFLRVGNYLGAISAYTHGIKLSDKMATLYVKRSAAQYAIENYNRCIEDASKALELMVPECESNKELRARSFARRGAALCQISAPQHGIPELEHALKLLPNDEGIKRDLLKVKEHFNL